MTTRSALGQHYTGTAGSDYFTWQNAASGVLGGRINARKFAAHIPPDATVVDFGCGAGYMLQQLPGRQLIGIEPAPAAREDALSRGLHVVASAGDIEPGTVDVIVSNHALEHTLEPVRELAALRVLLRPPGQLRLWVPIDDWRTQTNSEMSDTNHHLYTWTPLLLRNLLMEAGFSVDSVRVVSHAWPPQFQRVARLPERHFDRVCRIWSRLRRRRQIEAIATVGDGAGAVTQL